MAIRVAEDARIVAQRADEEVFLPGPVRGSEEEGPFPFSYPRVGRLIAAQRRMHGMDQVRALDVEVNSMFEWLEDGLGGEAWEHIDARVNDPNDLLDSEHLVKLYQMLQETSTSRPTTSSKGASRQPWKKQSTAAPSPQESASES